MTTQISQTGRIDLHTADVHGPVINYPGPDHFVQVKITSHLSLLITTAAEAQELETRFAAARHYLSDEPEFAHAGEVMNPTTHLLETLPAVNT